MLIERRRGYRVSPFRVLEIKLVSQDNDLNLTPIARVLAFDSRSGRVGAYALEIRGEKTEGEAGSARSRIDYGAKLGRIERIPLGGGMYISSLIGTHIPQCSH